jgi:hypothetical protein
MKSTQGGSVTVQTIWIIAGILVIIAASAHIFGTLRSSTVHFTTPYQAILLTNGSAYFGKLADYGGAHPVLTDVYYIVNQTDPQTKQSKPVLVKRGKELHEPDRMYLNPNQILFVETVGPNSKVAQLIDQSH